MDFGLFDKPSLRRILAARRHALTPDERADMEDALLTRLLRLPAWAHAPVICGYMSTRGEPETRPIWQAATAAGKTFALPRTLTDAADGRMQFRATPGFCPERLLSGRFGISEPPDESDFPVLSPEALRGALILVPGLGFDDEGFRVGFGGGYYDRFLDTLLDAAIPVHTVGLCPSVCRVKRLPREAHDRPVEVVLSFPDLI